VITNDNINDGPAPARSAVPEAAVPTVAKIPAPMIAPIPMSVTLKAVSVRFSENCGPPTLASISSRFLVRKIPRSKMSPPGVDLINCYLL
jgi:hypothetical protein